MQQTQTWNHHQSFDLKGFDGQTLVLTEQDANRARWAQSCLFSHCWFGNLKNKKTFHRRESFGRRPFWPHGTEDTSNQRAPSLQPGGTQQAEEVLHFKKICVKDAHWP